MSLANSYGYLPVILIDFNNDNYLDIISASENERKIFIWYGQGDGTFEEKLLFSIHEIATLASIAMGDFNDDNQWDIIILHKKRSFVSIIFGSDNGTLDGTLQVNVPVGFDYYQEEIVLNDFNQDGHLDFIVTAKGRSNYAKLLFGYGTGDFKMQTILVIKHEPQEPSFRISSGDFNSDGNLDLITWQRSISSINIFLNKPLWKNSD